MWCYSGLVSESCVVLRVCVGGDLVKRPASLVRVEGGGGLLEQTPEENG
jgi:hypothetical protein